ncbi:MAG: homocysteine S-methyltransferase family protein [Lachnospiraceae bacterium]|nr:homocysteine S-methyltransferase family protein [Lachnospiraceae bacterium]
MHKLMTVMEAAKQGFVFFEGGCGSILQAAGLAPGELPETWNRLHPEIIQKMHFDYMAGGVNILKTNTFGANSMKFGEEGEDSLENLIHLAIDNARHAIKTIESGKDLAGNDLSAEILTKADTNHYVALDVGPLGKLLKPLGDLAFDDAVEIFKKTIQIGAAYGVDLILIETMNDLYEAKAAILAAKETCDLPIFLTTAYDESAKLLTGASPMTVVATAEGLGVSAVGVNCSLGPDQMVPIVEELYRYASIPVIVNPNAGLPRTENGRTIYDVTPELFTKSMQVLAEKGGRILGGCCGTTPAHIGAMIAGMDSLTPQAVTEKNDTIITSYTHGVVFGKRPILIGERINPTGKKKFKEALRNHDIDYILQEGLTQQEKKADVLDVNVGLPEIDEPSMMEEVIYELQAVTDLPLQIDTTNVEAMERALRHYNGKPMVNSVNGKQEEMDKVFPLVKKYGGLLVALTIDEAGIPETAEGRIAVAEKIYKEAAKYGIKAKDIIIDPLAMSISADPRSALVTLDALKGIKDRLGGLTSLGVSNISFGLPSRELVTSSFFMMALQNGLNAAIMNPSSAEMKKIYYTFMALAAIDENCTEYIEYATTLPAVAVVAAPAAGEVKTGTDTTAPGEQDPLVTAVVKGLKERSAALTEEYVKTKTAMDIIDGMLIPALDIVGKGFEEKKMFLPQLLMSAEAASAAFDVIKASMAARGAEQEKKGKIVIATVKGDIHDIGKNIVKVLLENYGFDVIDLGKDVPPELIVETVKKEDVHFVGLSALMTTTVPAMEETIKQLKEAGLDAKVCVGGAVLTQEYADMIHATWYAKDAMETVRIAEEFFAS